MDIQIIWVRCQAAIEIPQFGTKVEPHSEAIELQLDEILVKTLPFYILQWSSCCFCSRKEAKQERKAFRKQEQVQDK